MCEARDGLAVDIGLPSLLLGELRARHWDSDLMSKGQC